MQITSLSAVTCAERREKQVRSLSSLRQITPDVCIVLERRLDLFIPALNQTFQVRMFNFTSKKDSISRRKHQSDTLCNSVFTQILLHKSARMSSPAFSLFSEINTVLAESSPLASPVLFKASLHVCSRSSALKYYPVSKGWAMNKTSKVTVIRADADQCWGKLLLKVMHYDIALLPKKSNLLCCFLWKVMYYVTFSSSGLGLLVCNINKSYIWQM